jgi:hypothetical protein
MVAGAGAEVEGARSDRPPTAAPTVADLKLTIARTRERTAAALDAIDHKVHALVRGDASADDAQLPPGPRNLLRVVLTTVTTLMRKTGGAAIAAGTIAAVGAVVAFAVVSRISSRREHKADAPSVRMRRRVNADRRW